MTVSTPEPPREPQCLQAWGGLSIPESRAAVSRAARLPRVALSRPGRSQLDVAIGLWLPQLSSKFTPFFPPQPASRRQPEPTPLAPTVPRDVLLAAPKGPRGLGTEFEAAALRSEITSGLSSRLSLRSISRTR